MTDTVDSCPQWAQLTCRSCSLIISDMSNNHGEWRPDTCPGRADAARTLWNCPHALFVTRSGQKRQPPPAMRLQCPTDREKRLMTSTPAMISPMPIRAAASRCCPNHNQLTTEISTMPTPDQIA